MPKGSGHHYPERHGTKFRASRSNRTIKEFFDELIKI